MGTEEQGSDAANYPAIPGQPPAKNFLAQNVNSAEVDSHVVLPQTVYVLCTCLNRQNILSLGCIYHGKLVLNAQMDPYCHPTSQKDACVLWYLVEAVLFLAL